MYTYPILFILHNNIYLLLCQQSDDEDTLKVFGHRKKNKPVPMNDMELTDSEESLNLSGQEYAVDLEPNPGMNTAGITFCELFFSPFFCI